MYKYIELKFDFIENIPEGDNGKTKKAFRSKNKRA